MSEDNKNTPSVLEQIEAIKGTDEFKTLISNSNTAYFDEKIGGKVSEIHGFYDKVLEDTMGIKKDPSKKSTDLLREALTGLNKELSTLKEKQGKGSEEEKAANTEELNLLKGKLEQLQTANADYEKKLSSEQEKNLLGKVNNSLSKELATRSFLSTYSKEHLEQLVEIRTGRLMSRSTVKTGDDGKDIIIHYKDAEKTKPYLDTVGNPMSTKGVVDLEYGGLFVTKKKGGNTPKHEQGEAQGDAMTLDMSKVTTRERFFLAIDHALKAKGIAKTHEDYKKIKNATYAAYEVDKMPMS